MHYTTNILTNYSSSREIILDDTTVLCKTYSMREIIDYITEQVCKNPDGYYECVPLYVDQEI